MLRRLACAGLGAALLLSPAAGWTRAARVWLGVRVVATTAQLRTALGVDAERGALVMEVESGGPAEGAGVRAGDVVVRVAGRAVGDAGDVQDALHDRRPGDRVDVELVRARTTQTRSIVLAAAPPPEPFDRDWWTMPELSPDVRQRLRRFRDDVERRLRELERRWHRHEEGDDRPERA
jgi:hypothetical protein